MIFWKDSYKLVIGTKNWFYTLNISPHTKDESLTDEPISHLSICTPNEKQQMYAAYKWFNHRYASISSLTARLLGFPLTGCRSQSLSSLWLLPSTHLVAQFEVFRHSKE